MRIILPYKQLVILIDSSGKGYSEKTGPCLAFWSAYLYDPFNKKLISITALKMEESIRYEIDVLNKKAQPIRCGMIFSDKRGPNIIFYEGIINLLQSCQYLTDYSWNLKVLVLGDNKKVIDQINNNSKIDETHDKFKKQVKKIEKEYKERKVDVQYIWIPRKEYSTYQQIDSISRELQEKMMGNFRFNGKNNKKKLL